MISKERLYVNADRSRVVPEDDPDAAYLLVGAGCFLDDAEADRLGLTAKPTPTPTPPPKRPIPPPSLAKPPAKPAVVPPADKG